MESIQKLLQIKNDLLRWGTPQEVFDLMLEEVGQEEGLSSSDVQMIMMQEVGE